jgi:hypothetical protein
MNKTLPSYSIKSLYAPALAEGEGVGTAYEYFAKRLMLAPWLRQQAAPQRMLIAGLPQKYGASLDFVLLAHDLGAELVVVDERPEALQKLAVCLDAYRKLQPLPALRLELQAVRTLPKMETVDGRFDLAISSEVLQRVPEQAGYVARLGELSTAVALFCPNADNPAHTNLSGLSGLYLEELENLVASALHDHDDLLQAPLIRSGYIDMPPFPPGIVRSEEQREQATRGRFEALAMWSLGYYARLENFLPNALRRRRSHIVYCLSTT